MLSIRNEGIILEKTSLNFEAKGVLNPACIKVDDIVHMFYRALSKDDISSIGYCQLKNNKVIKRLDKPVLFPEHDYEKKGVEDPRIILNIKNKTAIYSLNYQLKIVIDSNKTPHQILHVN